MFLIDTLPGTEYQVQTALISKLEKWGFSLTSSIDRLKSFYSVESSYMAMFLVLGGLGMLLGSAGMTIVILRNIQERQNELALLTATGYAPHQLLKVVLIEYGMILGIGLAIGLTASLTAIWPSLHAPGGHLPWIPIAVLIVGMLLFQIVWILLAVWIALRAPLLEALRNQ
jgi:ABC-type antimicrobial peptide transport system permease subunit